MLFDTLKFVSFHATLSFELRFFLTFFNLSLVYYHKLSNPLVVTPPNSSNSGISWVTNQYPSSKEIDLWLPQPNKPIKFDEGTQLPTNYGYRYYTFVFCSPDGLYDNKHEEAPFEISLPKLGPGARAGHFP